MYYFINMDGANVYIHKTDAATVSFTENRENSDWVAYQEWLAEGNTPEAWPPVE